MINLNKSSLFTVLLVTINLCHFSCKSSHNKLTSNSSITQYASFNADTTTFQFKNGDILFQDLDCGDLCDAIEKVTHGIAGKSFSHIGLVYFRNDSTYIIEAIGKCVQLTLLNTFMSRSVVNNDKNKIIVGRLIAKYQQLNDSALQFALSKIGTPYDEAFIYNNQKYYCSELIYDAYKFANYNKPFFQLEPMTFKDPATGETFPAWTKYYSDLKTPIPERQLGCNPAGISRSHHINIVKSFY